MSKNIKLALKPGTYIVAVSGGVDSMVLLDILRRDARLKLVVVHVNHGIRDDSQADEALVASFAMSHNLTFESARLQLGKGTSEAAARKARYNFLRHCRSKYKASSIITAHHQDDMLETAVINLIRGTGWHGLAPFSEPTDILRPLLQYKKSLLLDYAKKHKIPWREDSTNANQAYLRNYIRLTLLPQCDKRSSDWRKDFLRYIRKQRMLRRTITSGLRQLNKKISRTDGTALSIQRYSLITLPASVAYESLQQCLRDHCGYSLERPLAEALLIFAKVARVGKLMPINNEWQCRAEQRDLVVEPRTPVVS